MLRRVIGFIVALTAIAITCRAEETSTNVILACQKDIQAKMVKAGEEYVQGLDNIAKGFQQKGALEQLLLAQEEKKRFQREGTVEPKDLVSDCSTLREWQQKYRDYEARITKSIARNWVAKLEKDKGALTRAGKIKEAVVTKQASELLVQTYQLDAQEPQPNKSATASVPAPAKRPLTASTTTPVKPVLAPEDTDHTLNEADWVKVGDWSLKTIKAAPEQSGDSYELEFDVAQFARQSGPFYVWFRYSSYASPQIANVRLLVDGNEISRDKHTCNPISHRNTVYTLSLPATRSNARIVVRAQFNGADGFGNVYVRKPISNR